jgi:chromosome segregation ATPase
VTRKVLNGNASRYAEKRLVEQDVERKQEGASRSFALLQKWLDFLNAEVTKISAERDALKERVNVLTESVDWLSTENETQRQEIERLRDIEKEADTLRIKCATTKDNTDEMRTGRGSFREQPTAEDLPAMGNETSMVTAERGTLKKEYEVAATENNTLRQQLQEMRDAAEGMRERTDFFSRAVLSLASENEDLRQELEKASDRGIEADILRTEYNVLTFKLEELITESNQMLLLYCEDLSVEKALLETRKQIQTLSKERDFFKKCHVGATIGESNLSEEQARELSGTGEGRDLPVEELKEAVVTLTPETQVRNHCYTFC